MRSPTGSKPKLLVIDDESDNLDLLYRTFYREYKVLRAESGPEAIALLEKEGEVAAIISDQRMPAMTGTELLRQMVVKYPDTMRIILTGYTDVEDLVEAINTSKVFKYVTKPWDEQELRAVVRQAVETHQLLKVRTAELRRSLQQETLLNAISQAINSASGFQPIAAQVVATMRSTLDVSCCMLRPCQGDRWEDGWFAAGGEGWGEDTVAAIAHAMPLTTVLEVKEEADLHAEPYPTAGVRSLAIVPLVLQQEVLAVLGLYQCDRGRTWEPDELDLLATVADRVALALSQARAYERVRELARREALVNTIAAAIRSSLEPQEVFAAITQQLGEALNVDGCALSLWTDADEFVQCVGLYTAESGALAGKNSLPQSTVRIEGNPLFRRLVAEKVPIAIDDLGQQPEFQADLPLRSPSRSLMLIPLIADGKIIGSISLRQTDRPRRWLPSELELAKAVASQAAIAVQQAHLYQKTKQQAQRLLELDRQKTEFFQNISHEFRTPLTLTIGPLETAIARAQPLPLDRAQIALRNCRRLLRLVNQLLDLQRLDAGRMQASFRPCDLAGCVRQILEAFQHYCDRKGLALSAQLTPCPPVYLDLEKFDKILYNLLSNAMKFTPSGGSIAVSVSAAGDRCVLRVEDTGIGIRADQIPHLFERFRQAEGSVNRSYEGSGLGLALVKELVELHGGQVSVESTYGHGTAFTLWFPLGSTHLPAEQTIDVPVEVQTSRLLVELADLDAELVPTGEGVAEPTAATGDRGDNRTVLVVDDNADLRRYVTSVLREGGYCAIAARNGAEGYDRARQYRPDLIVTDLMMPEVSGLDLIRMLRADDSLKGTPVILLTAKADEETRIEGVEQGADAYLSKPFNDRELLAEARNLIALKDNERRVAELNRYLTESVLKRFLPPALVAKAAAGELSLDLRPEPRMIAVLFSDIVGFSEIANTLRSRRVAEVLNQYLAEMTRIVFAHGGTVDKFMGDGILALFGVPEDMHPNLQVRNAVNAARDMQRALAQLNAAWQEQGIPVVRFRCGIHQGTAVVGMFGGQDRADYTAIGPTVNIAARIQAAAAPDSILVSAVVADYLDESEIVKSGPLQLKGIDETVLTFLVTPASAASEASGFDA